MLVHRGLVAWMQTAGPFLAPLVNAPPTGPEAPVVLPASLHDELVQLMGDALLTIAGNPTL